MKQSKTEKLQILNDDIDRIKRALDYDARIRANTDNFIPAGFVDALLVIGVRLTGLVAFLGAGAHGVENAKRFVEGKQLTPLNF